MPPCGFAVIENLVKRFMWLNLISLKYFFRAKHLRRTITDKSVPNFDYQLLHQVRGNSCLNYLYNRVTLFVLSAINIDTYSRKVFLLVVVSESPKF